MSISIIKHPCSRLYLRLFLEIISLLIIQRNFSMGFSIVLFLFLIPLIIVHILFPQTEFMTLVSLFQFLSILFNYLITLSRITLFLIKPLHQFVWLFIWGVHIGDFLISNAVQVLNIADRLRFINVSSLSSLPLLLRRFLSIWSSPNGIRLRFAPMSGLGSFSFEKILFVTL